jgi:hypothetical protein
MGPWEETRDLVQWVRDHNVQAAGEGKPLIHSGGKDLTVRGDTLTVPLPRISDFYVRVGAPEKVRRVTELSQKASQLTATIEQILRDQGPAFHLPPTIDPDHLDAVTSLSYDQLEDSERDELASALTALQADLDTNAAAYAAKTSSQDVEDARMMVTVARQIREDLEYRLQVGVVYGPTNGGNGGDPANPLASSLNYINAILGAGGQHMPPTRHVRFLPAGTNYTPEQMATYQEGRKTREVHLAENVSAMLKRWGKTFDYAATGHLKKIRGGADTGNDYAEGNFLADELKADYVVLAGTAIAFDDAPGSLQATLRAQSANAPNAIEGVLDASTIPSGVVGFGSDPGKCTPAAWLGSEHVMWNGFRKVTTVPGKAFDGIYWVKTATHAHRLP